MSSMNLGRQPSVSEQHMYSAFFYPIGSRRSPGEKIIIHHLIDSTFLLQMEVERRCPIHGITFERFVLKR